MANNSATIYNTTVIYDYNKANQKYSWIIY
jgi:hypothetical protein